MRIFFIVLLPFAAHAMDYELIDKSYQEQVMKAYIAVKVAVKEDGYDFAESVIRAKELEEKYARSLNPAFYFRLYVKEITTIEGNARAYHQLVEQTIPAEIEWWKNRDPQKYWINRLQDHVAIFGAAKGKLRVAEELSERIRKKAGL